MRWVHALGAAVAATTLVGSVAQATLSVSLVQVPVNGTAGATIGSPARTYQLKVTQSAGEKFNVANLQTALGGSGNGYLYAAPNHDNATARNTNFAAAYSTTDPNFYDTMVSTPAFDVNPTGTVQAENLNVTGSADWPVGPGTTTPVVPTTTGNNNAGNQTLNIVWGDKAGNQATTATDGSTSYLIAQFTVVGSKGGFLRGYTGGTAATNTPLYFPNASNNATGALATALNALNGGNGGAIYLPILGDLDKDGVVGLSDINLVKANAGTNNAAGDVDGDGVVGLTDINLVKANAGNSISAPAAGGALGSLVPEPGSIGLLAGLGALFAGRRRK